MSKKTMIILAGVLFLVIALWGGAKYYATQRVERFITEANENGNRLEMKDWGVSLGFFIVSLHAESVELEQRIGPRMLTGSLRELSMEGLSLRSLLFSKQPRITALSLTQPELRVRPMPPDTIQQDTSGSNATRILPLIGDFNLADGELIYQTGADSSEVLELFGISVEREDFSLSDFREDWQDARFSIDSIHYPTAERAAAWHLSRLSYEPKESVLAVEKIQLSPYETAQDYLRRQQYRAGWLAVSFEALRLKPFQLDSVLGTRRSLALDSMLLGSVSVANYVDPALPDRPQKPKKLMPVENFRRLGFPLTVRYVGIEQAQIIYAILGEENDPAELAFTNAQITMRNLSTQPTSDSLYVDLNSTFDRTTQLEAHFAFDQQGTGRTLNISGKMAPYDMKNINPLMIAAANAYVESGQLETLEYQAAITGEVATGRLLFRYQDLQLDLQNAWFKNLLKGAVLQNRNPEKDGDLRYGQIYHEHGPENSFFNLYWKAILSGLKSTVVKDFIQNEKRKSEKVDG